MSIQVKWMDGQIDLVSCSAEAVGQAPNCFNKEVVETMVQIQKEKPGGGREPHLALALKQRIKGGFFNCSKGLTRINQQPWRSFATPSTFYFLVAWRAGGGRPIIFALSNPMSQAEITAEDCYNFSDGEVRLGWEITWWDRSISTRPFQAIFGSGTRFPTSDLQEEDSFWVPVEFASTFYGNVKVEQFRHLYCAANLRDFGYTVLTDTQVSWKRVAVFGLRWHWRTACCRLMVQPSIKKEEAFGWTGIVSTTTRMTNSACWWVPIPGFISS